MYRMALVYFSAQRPHSNLWVTRYENAIDRMNEEEKALQICALKKRSVK